MTSTFSYVSLQNRFIYNRRITVNSKMMYHESLDNSEKWTILELNKIQQQDVTLCHDKQANNINWYTTSNQTVKLIINLQQWFSAIAILRSQQLFIASWKRSGFKISTILKWHINSSTAVCYLSTAWKKSGRGPASFSGWSLSTLSFFMLPRNSSSLMAMPSAFSSFPAALA